MRLRVGRRVGRTLYVQLGPEPSDEDVLVGMVDTPSLAALLVSALDTGFTDEQRGLVLTRVLEELERIGSARNHAGPGD